MSMSTLENDLVVRLRVLTGNPKITKSWIMEWSTGEVVAREGETLYRIEGLGINCAVKQPTPKPKTPKAL